MTAWTILHLPFQLQQRLFYLHFKNEVTATTKPRTVNMEFKCAQYFLFFLVCFSVVSTFLLSLLLFFPFFHLICWDISSFSGGGGTDHHCLLSFQYFLNFPFFKYLGEHRGMKMGKKVDLPQLLPLLCYTRSWPRIWLLISMWVFCSTPAKVTPNLYSPKVRMTQPNKV